MSEDLSNLSPLAKLKGRRGKRGPKRAEFTWADLSRVTGLSTRTLQRRKVNIDNFDTVAKIIRETGR